MLAHICGEEIFIDNSSDVVGAKWFAREHVEVDVVGFLTEMGGDAGGVNELDEGEAATGTVTEPFNEGLAVGHHIDSLHERRRKIGNDGSGANGGGGAVSEIQGQQKTPGGWRRSHSA